jgi:hypothetical protein
MVPSHRRALRARLLFLRYIDGLVLNKTFSSRRLGVAWDKVMAAGTPANPATLVQEERRLDEN